MSTVGVPILVALITAAGVVLVPMVSARLRDRTRVQRVETSAVYSTAEAFVRAIAEDNRELRQQMSTLRDDMAAAKQECDQEIAKLQRELARLRPRR